MTGLRTRGHALRVALAALAVVAMAIALTSTGTTARPGNAPAIWHPPIEHLWNGASLNWAGYDAVAGPYTEVSANWAQPGARCGVGENSYASFWVGLDGGAAGDGTVEQTGTDTDCSNGVPVSYTWLCRNRHNQLHAEWPVTPSRRPFDLGLLGIIRALPGTRGAGRSGDIGLV